MNILSIKKKNIYFKWFLIDVKNKILGRIASKIAIILRGKFKKNFFPNINIGDYVIVINAKYLKISGKKKINKIYYKHSGFPGGISKINFFEMQKKFPCLILKKAIKGMLPKGPLGYKIIKKLKVYSCNVHPHIAQQPKILNF
ncbi:50S ribosomal protein L13 [Candidatus Zinderia endosymbiont of Aphrophora alni]|uniref:50S ribosomal protein L13 n=1 Tax=Candidatus Zinderia endosymbiont of Aphrophora alni TaxID=3077951 RepID=UPI0030CDC5AA